MRKYLELFTNGFDATLTEKTKVENRPYVGYSPSEGIVFTEVPEPVVSGPWVTFTAEEAGSTIGLAQLSTNQTLEYSTDTTTWNTMDTSTSITLTNVGDEVYVRGILSADNTRSNYTQFNMTGKIAASGNCNAIWNYEDLNAPLKTRCGSHMFSDCSSLTAAPEFPATTLAERCYYNMFSGCSSLTAAPALPATTLANWCYNYMFSGCSSLTAAPELPAMALASNCYSSMFRSCTSLTTAPELPATTLADSCYYHMFYNCFALTVAPELPATTLADWCYGYMFYDCHNLSSITCLATDISASKCTTSWVGGVASTGTFIKHPDMTSWTTGVDGIRSGWTVVDAEL